VTLLKRIFGMVALHLLLAWPILLCAQNKGSISGHVTNSITGAGIEGVRLRVCPTNGGTSQCGKTNYQAVTDTTGGFRIGGIPDGQYIVINEAKDFTPTPIPAARAGPFPSVTVSGESRVDLQMTPYASVRGRVFDPEGKPAGGIVVKLGFQTEKVTGENGEFVFESVPPGSWMTLSATPKAQAAAAKDGTWIVTTYYPSVVDSGQAVKIAVAGVDASYDIHLQTAPARAIRGVVIGADGKPGVGARLTITRTEPGMASFVRGQVDIFPSQVEAALPVETKPDGTFAFPPIVEGEWVVRAFLLQRGEVSSGAAKLTVSTRADSGGNIQGAGDIQNVEIRLTPPFDVEVTADWGDSPPPETPRGFALASLIPLDSQTDLQLARLPIDEPGKPQRFHLFPGRYFIGEGRTRGFAPQPEFYAAAAMLGGSDVLGQVVELSGPASLKLIYKTGGGSVRGTVEKGSDAVVVLMADATLAARVGYAGRCDSNGTFSIPDLPPGEYTAVAVEGMLPFAADPLQPQFVSALARDGKRVKVEAGAAAQVELRVAVTR
jgi:hypothetical protein